MGTPPGRKAPSMRASRALARIGAALVALGLVVLVVAELVWLFAYETNRFVSQLTVLAAGASVVVGVVLIGVALFAQRYRYGHASSEGLAKKASAAIRGLWWWLP